MGLTPGARLGSYTIGPRIGVGGMGEVYQATDTTLGRQVAIKVLPDTFAQDAERLARFEREARTLAALNHPNIAIIYGLERGPAAAFADVASASREAGHHVHALVMELVDGPTLADEIQRRAGPSGPAGLPLDEALAIARQIAAALEAAHEQGIIHRDLKPANVKVRDDGTVKVLDFGLAKMLDTDVHSSANLSMSPTITTPAMTQMGVILGTAAYMSPEQARGKPVDKRADVWAFGCVLYEMLTGRRAFEDEDVSLTLSKVLQSEPAFDVLPPSIPSHIRQTLRLCLRKPLKERLPDIASARMALDGVFHTAADGATATRSTPTPRWRRAAAIVAIAIGAAVVGGLAVWRLLPSPAVPSQTVTRFAILAPASVAPAGAGTGRHVLALSPLGTHLVYWGDNQLFVHALDRLEEAVPLRGTEDAREPFFSPDGQWIGFHEAGELKRVSVNGGVPVAVGAARNPWGVSWDGDGVLRYGQGTDGIWQMPASGGKGLQLISVETGAQAHGPQLLPGGEWVLYTLRPAAVSSWDQAQVVAQSLKSSERVVLIERGRDARYVSTGHLVYGLNGTLLAVPFDVRERRVRGAAVPLVEGVLDADVRTGALHFSVSESGTLAYLTGASSIRRTLMWAGEAGRLDPLPADALFYDAPRVSPDGTRVAVNVSGPDGLSVNVYDLKRKMLMQVTSKDVQGRAPLWSRDGRRVVFYSELDGGGLYSQAVDGTGTVQRLTTSRDSQVPYSWSIDERTLVFEQKRSDRTSPGDIHALSLDGTGRVVPLVASAADDREPALSPNGKWLAYTAFDQNGISQVFVRPFPDVESNRWQISTDSGFAPLWAPDGKRLFFISRRGEAMAVPIETEPAFRAGIPVKLFDLPPYYRRFGVLAARQWDIAPDGRFLIVNPGAVTTTGDPTRMQMVVVTNWFEELKRLVPNR